jgi:type II secretory pathway pseudopilin PulG
MKSNFQNLGQSIFEVVIAVAVSALIVTGIVASATNSIQNSTFSRDKNLAANYVQEAIEWLRRERDTDKIVFLKHFDLNTEFCLNYLFWSNFGKCSTEEKIPNTIFQRNAVFIICDGSTCPLNTVRATVTVSWEDSKGTHDVSSVTDFLIK